MRRLGFLLALVGVAAAAPAPVKKVVVDAEAFRAFSQAELVFTGKVTVDPGGVVSASCPPIYHLRLEFAEVEVLRGVHPGQKSFSYSVSGEKRPEFPPGTKWAVAAYNRGKGHWVIRHIRPGDDRQLDAARLAGSLPIGWKVEEGEIRCPWDALGKKAWPKGAPPALGTACARTGRPALMAGDGVEVESKQVLPEKVGSSTNPYGDGQFRITVTNRNGKPVSVPALLTDGKTIFWEDSLAVVWEGKSYALPGAGKLTAAQPVRLKAGESVSTVVDVLPLQSGEWNYGGSRLYFQFSLGEKATTNFFYYNSTHHGPMREAALREWKKKETP